MQDEINEKSVTLGVRVVKTTAVELKRTLEKLLVELKKQTDKTAGNIKGKGSE
jgi:uncharacterized protein (DUF111 family)